jgi:hypothetical protein
MNVLLTVFILLCHLEREGRQMTPSDVVKTSEIAKVRILVEQVIRRFKDI